MYLLLLLSCAFYLHNCRIDRWAFWQRIFTVPKSFAQSYGTALDILQRTCEAFWHDGRGSFCNKSRISNQSENTLCAPCKTKYRYEYFAKDQQKWLHINSDLVFWKLLFLSIALFHCITVLSAVLFYYVVVFIGIQWILYLSVTHILVVYNNRFQSQYHVSQISTLRINWWLILSYISENYIFEVIFEIRELSRH